MLGADRLPLRRTLGGNRDRRPRGRRRRDSRSNPLLAHLALTHLGGRGSTCIYLAIHAGTPYRDCTVQFIEETQRSLDFQSGGVVRLVAPYVAWSKQLVIEHALRLGVPLELTHSCERSTAPCGECPSCIDREALLARL